MKTPHIVKSLSLITLSLCASHTYSQEVLLPCDEVEQEVLAQTPQDIVERITAFTPATAVDRVNPRYPSEAARIGAEGWVQMSYVIDTEGNVVDPVVEDFGGNRKFKSAALSAIKKWKFDPAMKDGKPTEQCHQSVQFDFTMSGQTGAKRKFINTYKIIEELLQEEDFAQAETLIQKLHKDNDLNRYENAWLWSADASLAGKLDDVDREANSIKRTIASSDSHDAGKKTFNDEYTGYLHQRLFILQANLGHYSDALSTFDKIKTLPQADSLSEPLVSTAEKIRVLIASEEHVFVSVKLSDSGKYFHSLARNSFAFANIQGDVKTVEVRCESKREKFTVAEDFIWNIPASWGNCQVMIEGEDATTFDLVELSNA